MGGGRVTEVDTSRTTVYEPFAGRRRKFQLRLGEIEELETLCRAGIGEIMVRLANHTFRLADVRETVRLGLQGGGLSEPEATALVMRHVDDTPVADHLQLAANILSAAVAGVEVKKKPEPEAMVG
jgi:hypothetical protein